MGKKTVLLIGLLLVLAVGSSACNGRPPSLTDALDIDQDRDNGAMITETRDVQDFHGVRLLGSGDATIAVGQANSLVIEAEEAIMPRLTSDVVDGILNLGVEEGSSVQTQLGWDYTITVESLDMLEILGSSDVDIRGLSGGALSSTIMGSGDIVARGEVEAQAIVIAGTGNYHAFDLASETASVVISGSGDVDVDVTDSLDARIMGSGNVTYSGDPAVSESIMGSGSIRSR